MKKKPAASLAKGKATKEEPAPVVKVGFILECHRDGADHKVIDHVVGVTNPHLKRVYACAGSKRALFEQCDKLVEGLFEVDRCQRVFVVWDLLPCDTAFQAGGKPSCANERAHLWERLRKQDRNNRKTVMLCVTHELDNWLLADGAALTAVLSRPTHPIKPIPDQKDPENIPNPKAILKKLFKQHGRGDYEDVFHAVKIISEVQNLSKLERAPSFKRLREKLQLP